jgi:dGTPase
VELLEIRYPHFPGLHLSREVLDAQATRKKDGTAPAPLLETQVVDAADSIAYDTHDADDAVELGLVTMDELLEIPLVADAARRARDRYGPLTGPDLRRATLHEVVEFEVAELVMRSRAAIAALGIESVAQVREVFRGQGGMPGVRIVAHTPAIAAGKRALEQFLFQRVYRSDRVLTVRVPAQRKLTRLFDWYCLHSDEMPPSFRGRVEQCGVRRSVADYIAGMTDRFLDRDHDLRIGPG